MSTSNSPPQKEEDSNSAPALFTFCTVLALLSSVLCLLRVWSRRLTRQALALDDYLCFAALVAHHAVLAAAGVLVYQAGMGRDMAVIVAEDAHSVVVLFQGVFALEIGQSISSPLIRFSVLAFYRRIFPTSSMKLACNVLAALNMASCIAFIILTFLQCRPLKAYWHIELQALPTTKCFDTSRSFFTNSLINCCIDFLTLTLPIQEIFKLRVSTRRKVTIACVFLLGGTALAASVARTSYAGIILRDGISNFSRQLLPMGAATVIEIYAAVIGACMPTLVPVYRRLRYGHALKTYPESRPKSTPVDMRHFRNDDDILKAGSYSQNSIAASPHGVDCEGDQRDHSVECLPTECHEMERFRAPQSGSRAERDRSFSAV